MPTTIGISASEGSEKLWPGIQSESVTRSVPGRLQKRVPDIRNVHKVNHTVTIEIGVGVTATQEGGTKVSGLF